MPGPLMRPAETRAAMWPTDGEAPRGPSSFGSDDGARTRAILGNYGDALSTTDLLAQNTSKDVSSAASRVWNDNLDSSRSLRPRAGQSEKDGESAGARDQIERSTARKSHNDVP